VLKRTPMQCLLKAVITVNSKPPEQSLLKEKTSKERR
jgi:hypothetical protein